MNIQGKNYFKNNDMNEYLLLGLGSIVIAGIGAQWLAWRLKWPSIVILLALGFIAGPVTGLIKPDEVLGPLLLPLVSISVAIILFEGGLGLRICELKQIGKVVFSLVSFGVLINGVLIALSAHYILGLNFTISILLGAILVVTGPTVIIPLLRHIKPAGKVGSIIKWEGIVIDPIGAALAVLAFEYIIIGQSFSVSALMFFLRSIFTGLAVGAIGAWISLLLLKKYWIPDFLHGTVTLMFVVIAFILSNFLHRESGLFAVIAMGIIMGNQRKVEMQHIVSFKENLRVLIISTLFIILAARLNLKDFSIFNWKFLFFLLVLILIARPVSVFLSTFRSGLNNREKLFISWMAPRGIVAAAIVSIFAFELSKRGIAQAEYLVPVTFLVIIATVVIYGVSSAYVAQRLGLARNNPQGILILGAHRWGRLIAKKLQDEGVKVVLVDSNALNVSLAQEEGLNAYEENILNQDIEENIDLDEIGRLWALTANNEANSLAVLHFRDIFGRSEVYQLYPEQKSQGQEIIIPLSLRGRYLFGQNASYYNLTERFNRRGAFETISLLDDLNEESFHLKYGKDAIALFMINEKNELVIFTADTKPHIKKGNKLIVFASLVE